MILFNLNGFRAVHDFARLGYVRGNEQSCRFWEKNGFAPTGVIAHEEAYDVVVMARAL